MRRSTCAQFQDNNSSLRSRRVTFCPSCPSSSSSSTAESSLLLSTSPASVFFPCCFLCASFEMFFGSFSVCERKSDLFSKDHHHV
jgi:hypothetical protein